MPPKVYRFGHTYDVVVGVGCAGLRATFGIGAEMKATGSGFTGEISQVMIGDRALTTRATRAAA